MENNVRLEQISFVQDVIDELVDKHKSELEKINNRIIEEAAKKIYKRDISTKELANLLNVGENFFNIWEHVAYNANRLDHKELNKLRR